MNKALQFLPVSNDEHACHSMLMGSCQRAVPQVQMLMWHACREGQHAGNATKFKLMNNGLFELHIDFSLKSVPEEAPADAGKGKPAAKPKDTSAAGSCFIFEPKASCA